MKYSMWAFHWSWKSFFVVLPEELVGDEEMIDAKILESIKGKLIDNTKLHDE